MTATDLIYTRADKTDYGTIQNPDLDYECGTDAKNTFELTVPLTGVSIKKGAYVYIDGSDYMGQVTTVDPSSIDNTMIYGGPTWQGLLDERIIQPDNGQAYYHVSGDANAVLGAIISRIGLSSIMGASATASGITVSYDFRYQKGYAGISAMLSAANARVTGSVSGGKIILHAEHITDWSQNQEYDGEQTQINMAVDYRPVNHLIALGSGEGAGRIRYDLYSDVNGNISTTQTLFGEDLHEETYDYTSADLATLQTEAPKKLQEYLDAAVTITVNASIANIGIGDIAGAYIGDTGMSAKATVTKKTVKLSNGAQSVSFTAGGAKSASIEDTRNELSRQSLNAINEALAAHDTATAAQTSADEKTRTFVDELPYPPYSVGDTFVKTATGETSTCTTAKTDTSDMWVIEHGAGLLDLAVTGATNLLWVFPDMTTSTATRPKKTVMAGVTRCYASNWTASGVQIDSNYVTQTAYHGNVKDLPRVKNYLSLSNCTQITGLAADLPRVTNTLNLRRCTQITGLAADLPRVKNYLDLYYCTQITGIVADLPRVTNFLDLANCTQITGLAADLPRVTNYLDLANCTQITGLAADLPRVTNFLDLRSCTQIAGALMPEPTLKTIYLHGSGMTPSDTDQTLINLAAVTTVTSGGILYIKHNRTSASDAAVASLAGKFTITEV